MLSTGLPVSRYVSVQVSLTSPGVVESAIHTALIIGTSPVIDAAERARPYGSISEMGHDFDSDSPEMNCAEIWFSQQPRPDNVMVGRWFKVSAPAVLVCGALSAAEQDIALWQAITAGEFAISVGGTTTNITALDFSAAGNLNAVASAIDAKLTAAAAHCVWSGQHFIFTTTATGSAAQIGYLTTLTAGTGTDISAMLKGTATTAAHLAAGAGPESALAALTAIDALYSTQFYGVICPEGTDADQEQLAAYCEAADPVHFLGVTTQDPHSMDAQHITDLAAVLSGFGYNKTAVQYSSTTKYAVASLLARILTTQWQGQGTAITLMYKDEPGVAPEQLSTTQANALAGKSCNVFTGVAIGTGIDILEYGVCASGEYVDTIIGADALALDIQYALFNALVQTSTKIPQTDGGMALLKNRTSAVCNVYVGNQYLAGGTWNAPGFGSLSQGDPFNQGYYVWSPSIGDQDEADRAARRAPIIQVAAKCAGAIHTIDVVIYVNQ